MLHRRRVDRIALGALAASALAGLVLWPELPSEMAIHWGAAGQPDQFVAKPLAVVGLPAFGVLTIAFTRLAPPSLTNTPGGEDLAVLFVGGVFTVLQGTIFAWNLGYRFDIWLVVAPILLAAAVLTAVVSRR
jgi:uncharacterized membrane protein